jgi:tyrosine-protein phosphatase SIW14
MTLHLPNIPTLRRPALIAITLLLAATLSISEEPQPKSEAPTGPKAARIFGERHKLKGVGNFGEVTPKLFRGAQPTPEGFAALAKMGVGMVVDARGERADSEGKIVSKHGMTYVSIPWHCPFPHDDAMARFLKLMRDNPDKKVFVHCRLGDDRTGMMVASYRMAAQGWSADDAMQEMKFFGFSTVHHVICPSLATYEHNFPSHLKSNPAFEGLTSPSNFKAQNPK